MCDLIIKLKKHMEIEVQSLKNQLEDKTELLEELRQYCNEHCQHIWIYDWIDTDVENSQQIIYCEKCEISR